MGAIVLFKSRVQVLRIVSGWDSTLIVILHECTSIKKRWNKCYRIFKTLYSQENSLIPRLHNKIILAEDQNPSLILNPQCTFTKRYRCPHASYHHKINFHVHSVYWQQFIGFQSISNASLSSSAASMYSWTFLYAAKSSSVN